MTKHKQYGTKDISIESLLHRPTFINSRNTLSNTKLELIDFFPCKVSEFCFTLCNFFFVEITHVEEFFPSSLLLP
jgi:hypothetical protein